MVSRRDRPVRRPDARNLAGGPDVRFMAKLGIHSPSRALRGEGDPQARQETRLMASFFFIIIHGLIQLMIFVLLANAILSWLIVFDVINMRNRAIYQIAHFLDAVTRPILRPAQRIIPPFGNIDITPVIVMLVLIAFDQALLPMIFRPLQALVG
jgi:YggT family protein